MIQGVARGVARGGLGLALCSLGLLAWGSDSFAKGSRQNDATDKWHPGIYVKVQDDQLREKDGSNAKMEAIYSELKSTPQLRGIKVVLLWGRYEKKDPSTGAITYDFREIDEILNRLAVLDNNHLILSFAWREFKSTDGIVDMLPSDLRRGISWNDDPVWAHTKYDYLWAYRMSRKPGHYSYCLKLWDPMIISRIDAFLKALATHVDSHPHFNQISTTESALGQPIIPFGPGEGGELQSEGQLTIIRLMRKYFVRSLVVPAFNFNRKYVARVVSVLEKEGIGLGSPNSNKSESLTHTASIDAPGVLTYYPRLSGKVVLAPEIQGDDYRSSVGDDRIKDTPSYEALYLRVRDDLKANYTVMQRNSPFWLGDARTPSMLRFIQTYPAIVNDPTGAGGLNSAKPRSLLTTP